LNLAINAREAMPDGGQLIIETSRVKLEAEGTTNPGAEKPGDYVLLSIADTGVGMDETTKQHLFEPFFTTKGRAAAAGLGLASMYGTVKQLGGFITVESKLGEGTRFNIYLPRAAKDSEGGIKRLEPSFETQTIFVVEDESALRNVVCRILRK